jgi:hypothetical protein
LAPIPWLEAGNLIHDAIFGYYSKVHKNDVVVGVSTPMYMIILQAKGLPIFRAIGVSLFRPDILNLQAG